MDSLIDTNKKKCLEALIPRGLIGSGHAVLGARVTAEGLCPVRLGLKGERITSIEMISEQSISDLKLLLPRLIEPHAHIDKAFTWGEVPNLKGGYQEALHANLQELQNRTIESVYSRAERSLKLACRNGIRALRSHVDSFGFVADQTWEALVSVRDDWKQFVELQLVALVPLEYWSTDQGKMLALSVAKVGGLLGGVLVPPFDRKASKSSLLKLLKIANQLGCGIDLHIDESEIEPAEGLKLLINVLDQIEINVPITCSHSSSMGLLPLGKMRRLADSLAHHRVNVIALPLTNFWLLGRQSRRISGKRPFAPIAELQQAGVTVAIGGDNVQDPWFPAGNFDPVSLMSITMSIAQLAPWQRLGLAPFTTSASALMELEWDGMIQIGGPADFVWLDASSWSEALATSPGRKVMAQGKWVDENMFVTDKSKVQFD
ncbi:MAG: amidohydrolase family protein [Prochlorococcaceae cyanobacterium ETNP1_MAG_9]|nr:amidohydrolase family protein [Prochlorococcaceae cyanobacterium ETNP1_MAG_9]